MPTPLPRHILVAYCTKNGVNIRFFALGYKDHQVEADLLGSEVTKDQQVYRFKHPIEEELFVTVTYRQTTAPSSDTRISVEMGFLNGDSSTQNFNVGATELVRGKEFRFAYVVATKTLLRLGRS